MRKLFIYGISILLFSLLGCSDDEVKPELKLSETEIELNASVTEYIIKVTSVDSWNASSTASWCIISPSSGNGNGVFKITLEANDELAERNAEVKVISDGKTQIISVKQLPKSILSFSRSHISIEKNSVQDTLVITSSYEWTASEDLSWLTFSPSKGEAGKTVCTFKLDPNSDQFSRKGVVNFKLNCSDEVYSLDITQEGEFKSLRQRDSVALVEIFSSVLDPEIYPEFWSENWDVNKPITTWKGVATQIINKEHRVVELNMSLIPMSFSWTPWRLEEFPKEIGYLTELKILNIEHLKAFGVLPDEIGNLTNLVRLAAVDNNFTSIPNSIVKLKNLEELDMSENQLSGSLPESIGELVNLKKLKLSHNFFQEIPDIFSKMQKLKSLDISRSLELSFDGTASTNIFPESILSLNELIYLNISRNDFAGNFPEQIGNLLNLKTILAYDNKFEGSIPASIGNIKGLQTLNLARNLLSGSIPSEISNCNSLANLIVCENQLTGEVPSSFGGLIYIQTMDLSDNQLTGTLPDDFFKQTYLIELNLAYNNFSGVVPSSLTSCTSVNRIKLDYNKFTVIPNGFDKLQNLESFTASNNLFISIPEGFKYLVNLGILDLSGNNIEGTIPEFLAKMKSLGILGLSNNRFTGEIPQALIDLGQGYPGFSFDFYICPQQEGYGVTNCPDSSVSIGGGNGDLDSGMSIMNVKN